MKKQLPEIKDYLRDNPNALLSDYINELDTIEKFNASLLKEVENQYLQFFKGFLGKYVKINLQKKCVTGKKYGYGLITNESIENLVSTEEIIFSNFIEIITDKVSSDNCAKLGTDRIVTGIVYDTYDFWYPINRFEFDVENDTLETEVFEIVEEKLYQDLLNSCIDFGKELESKLYVRE